jgi:hypothetical protein
MKKRNTTIKIRRIEEQTDHSDFIATEPAERMQMMWQLAFDAWAFKGESIAESRLPRHIIPSQRPPG